MTTHNLKIKYGSYVSLRSSIEKFGKTFICGIDEKKLIKENDYVHFTPVMISGYVCKRADSDVYLITDVRRDFPNRDESFFAIAFVKAKNMRFDFDSGRAVKILEEA